MINISVVVPLYNKEGTIDRCIRSILNQEYKNFELLIVNDGSTDASYRKAIEYVDSRIRVITIINKGEGGARNKGIELSKYEYIAFLDADDEWSYNFLTEIFALIEKYPNAGLYCTSYSIVENGITHVPKFFFNEKENKNKTFLISNYFESIVKGAPPVTSSSCCINKRVISKISYFKENEPRGCDLDFWFRIANNYDIAFSKEISAIYHREAPNRVSNKFTDFHRPYILTLNRMINDCGDKNKKIYMQEFINKIELKRAYLLIKRHNLAEAKIKLKNIKTKIFRLKKIKTYMYYSFCYIQKIMRVKN